jgi:NADH dehydrogenase
MPQHRVVIVGAGFGGLQAALHLKDPDLEVVLVDRRNFHLFQPLAYQVATGALAPGEVCYPLRSIFHHQKNIRVVLAEATGFDLSAREVRLRTTAGTDTLSYDTLIVGGGSKYNYFGHEEWRDHAAELKTLEGALHIRAQVLKAFETAEVTQNAEERERLLTFVIVGAGPTGVEMAGQIAEIARDTRKDFRVADTTKTRVLLLEGGDRVLATFPEKLTKRAFKSLVSLGVTPLLGHLVTGIDADGVTWKADGAESRVSAGTVIWAAGVLAASVSGSLAEAAGAEVDKVGRLIVEPDLSLPGHPDVIALGDMVQIRDGEPLPGVAPVAMQMGRYAAKRVKGRLRGSDVGPFKYKDKGNLATIGRKRAVAELPPGIRVAGFPAWALWLGIHLWYLVGFQNRLLVFIRWGFTFFAHGRGNRLITGKENMP